MRQHRLFILCLILGFSQGCTNYLYTGKITAQDSFDTDREIVLYWNKTDPLIGSPKAGPATLLTQCSLRKPSFVEQEQGIVFYGDPGRDLDIDTKPIQSQDHVCGRFTNRESFVEISPGPLSLEILCNPEFDEFAVDHKKLGYLKARKDQPYTFDIQEAKKEWSLIGKILEESPPQCP